jgi:hypothetical protein
VAFGHPDNELSGPPDESCDFAQDDGLLGAKWNFAESRGTLE